MFIVKKFILKILEYISTPLNQTYQTTTTNVSTNTSLVLNTLKHTSNTGLVMIFADYPIHTSRFTSRIEMMVNDVLISSKGTNIQPNPNINSSDKVVFFAIIPVPKGSETTVTFTLKSQDSGTTGYIPAYRAGGIVIHDIKK